MTKRQAARIREGIVAANTGTVARFDDPLVGRAYIHRMETILHGQARRQLRAYARRTTTYTD